MSALEHQPALRARPVELVETGEGEPRHATGPTSHFVHETSVRTGPGTATTWSGLMEEAACTWTSAPDMPCPLRSTGVLEHVSPRLDSRDRL